MASLPPYGETWLWMVASSSNRVIPHTLSWRLMP